jgi:hypothetical protein
MTTGSPVVQAWIRSSNLEENGPIQRCGGYLALGQSGPCGLGPQGRTRRRDSLPHWADAVCHGPPAPLPGLAEACGRPTPGAAPIHRKIGQPKGEANANSRSVPSLGGRGRHWRPSVCLATDSAGPSAAACPLLESSHTRPTNGQGARQGRTDGSDCGIRAEAPLGRRPPPIRHTMP